MEMLIIVVLALAALGAVSLPVLRRGMDAAAAPEEADDRVLDADVARYREALRAGTVCPRCLRANPGGARFCAECGRSLETERTRA